MTNAEAERIVNRIRESGQYEYVKRSYEQPQWKVEQEEAFAAERAWIKQAFMSEPIGDEEQDRHPQFVRRYMGRPVRDYTPVCYERADGSRIYGWSNEQKQVPKQRQPSELQAGDTTELDSFLAGFSTK